MPDDLVFPGARLLSDGRLNLEQQKKRAKELHRGLTAGEPEALRRLAEHHPRGARGAGRLADAQLVLARENGFESWPKLKAHIGALDGARAAMADPAAAPDTGRTLHIRCGSDIRGALRRAGFAGGFHEFADPYCQGPVRDLPRPAFIAERAGFVARAYGLDPEAVRARLDREYGGLDRLEGHDEVVLWFEHDSYDQLILAFLLAELGGRARLSLVCADRAPGVRDFVGLGQLAPEVIRMLWGRRVRVGAEHQALGAVVWRALTAPSPEALTALAAAGTPELPPMAGALRRHLRELPSAANGLSLTEQLALDLLAEGGPMTPQALFGRLNGEREPLPFLGDAMFWSVLRDLEPLVLAEGGLVGLTPLGDEVRAGVRDRLAEGAPTRWVGGIEIRPGRPAWRWDPAAGRAILS